MKNFSENTRVQVPAAMHLCKLGYTYLDDIIEFDPRTNILTDVFTRSVRKLNPEMNEQEAKQLIDKIAGVVDNDDLGREFYSMLSANSGIKLIDFSNPDNNEWHVTTEFSCEHKDPIDAFRPDITCFINGLPLAFIEVKKPNNREGILAERDRIDARMRNKNFRRFLNLTQLMIFSNNQEYDNENRVPIQGAYYCCTSKNKAFFNVFREADETFVANYPYEPVSEETEKKILVHRNCVVLKSLPDYETNKAVNTPTNRILTSMLCRSRFLFLLRYGFTYVDRTKELSDGSKIKMLEKHVMRYQQLFASLSIRKMLERGQKGGIIWHTQGSGKTELAYYSVRSLIDFYAARNTAVKFYFIVDRIALMEQASDEFASRGLVVRTADTRESLLADFRKNSIIENSEGKPEIMVVNIQKFQTDTAKVNVDSGYNTNLQRIFFIDEAHRGYNPKGCFLANLLEADQNAVKIALTGTPLLKEERETWRVFGDYIDTYYYDKSIADGYTLKLMREPVETVYKEKIEDIIEKLTGHVEVKKSDIDRDKILEDEGYLNTLLDYIIDDFRKFRVQCEDDTVGAMIVCRTNPQARKVYDLWQRRFSNTVSPSFSDTEYKEYGMAADPANKYGGSKKRLRAALILHDEGDKEERNMYIDEYKKRLTVDVLIVNQMLLTGFDAPRLKKLYLGRSLDGHDLLQALTRVNRPYKNFKYGYVVDFVDIKENFEATNDRYLRELNRAVETNDGQQTGSMAVVMVSKEEVVEKMKQIKSVLFNFICDNKEEFRKQIDEIEEKSSLYELRAVLNDARAIVNQVRAFGDDELKAKIEDIASIGISTLVSEVTHRIERINLMENTDHKADVSGIINLALDELEFEFKKGTPEELRIYVNDIKERCLKVQEEFEANFDKGEEKYVVLAEEFRKYFRERGFIPQSSKDAKESIEYMDAVMKKIREINQRNNTLRSKYNGDERFVRIHKRINEQNQKRERPIISAVEYEIADNLSRMKHAIDDLVYKNVNILDNEDAFKQNSLAIIGEKLIDLQIKSTLDDRRYINNLITSEYFQQRNYIAIHG